MARTLNSGIANSLMDSAAPISYPDLQRRELLLLLSSVGMCGVCSGGRRGVPHSRHAAPARLACETRICRLERHQRTHTDVRRSQVPRSNLLQYQALCFCSRINSIIVIINRKRNRETRGTFFAHSFTELFTVSK